MCVLTARVFRYFTPDGYSYANVQYRAENRTSVEFRVKSAKDAHIGLFDKYNEQIAYEIIIGAGDNTYMGIRRKTQSNVEAFVYGTFLNASEFRAFWITWANGFIEIGRGNIIGHDRVLHWQDPAPLGVSIVAISNWYGSTGEWEFQAVPGRCHFCCLLFSI